MAKYLGNYRTVTDGKKFKKVVSIDNEGQIGLPTGYITRSRLRELPDGTNFIVNEKNYYVFHSNIVEYVKFAVSRKTQIIYPKDAAYILMQMNIRSGTIIGEAGTGSGGLTAVFSTIVGEEGKVYTYEKQSRYLSAIEENIGSGMEFDNVTMCHQDLENSEPQKNMDAFFIDIKEPWKIIENISKAVKPGGYVGILVPTTNQVSMVLKHTNRNHLFVSEVTELLKRDYKIISDRLRPNDRMVGHTGYLIFARKLNPEKKNFDPDQ